MSTTCSKRFFHGKNKLIKGIIDLKLFIQKNII